jgi:molybdate transport system permease protein
MSGLRWPGGDARFLGGMGAFLAAYVLLIVALLMVDASYTRADALWSALADPDIRYALRLSFASCTITALLSVLVAVPVGYLLSRQRFPGRLLIDACLDIPIVLPPLVIGLSLLVLFQTPPGRALESGFRALTGSGITYEVPAVVLAQFMVACAFAVRTMRATFDHINPRTEQVALTLGCTRAQAFFLVTLPEARRGAFIAGTLAWARALGEFGPILVFAGATRGRTEVLSTTVFLELTTGRLDTALAVSFLMVVIAVAVLLVVRRWGSGLEGVR